MSKIGLTKLERILAKPLALAPDFSVLVAWLASAQAASETAIAQSRIDREGQKDSEGPSPVIALFASGVERRYPLMPASFDAATAALITSGQER